MEGVFTISLDFELHWGVFDKRPREARIACYKNTIALIPRMLRLFEQYDVHVTWATVGSLFAEDVEEWNSMQPTALPKYINKELSAYEYVATNGLKKEHYGAHFAPKEVASILNYKGQELGTHTFGHYYCLEPVNGEDAFDADLNAANKIASKLKHQSVSLVFPRNQYNQQNLTTCLQNGIQVVRSNPASWFWSPIPDTSTGLMRKLFRTGDAYLPLSNQRTSYSLKSIKKEDHLPVQLPASRLLRSWSPKYKVGNKLALNRVVEELKTAAKEKECYHLWWHPENFGDFPEQNMENLKVILETYQQMKQKHGMVSWNMGEYLPHIEKN